MQAIMRLPCPLLLVCLLALGLGPGCAFRQKESLRVGSFQPHAGHAIDGVALESYLASRTAALTASDRLTDRDMQAGVIPEGAYFGCAAAIDPRGYYLTAAHNLRSDILYLLQFESGRKVRALHAHVVWRGDQAPDGQDLAILHVSRPLAHTFAWADIPEANAAVLAVGLRWQDDTLRSFQSMGGHLAGPPPDKLAETHRLIATDIPLQSGDSGGPLLDTDGRLLGINVRAAPPLARLILPRQITDSYAEYPRPEQLAAIIEKDHVTRFSPPLATTP